MLPIIPPLDLQLDANGHRDDGYSNSTDDSESSSPDNDDYFEGCGREGPIRCSFFSEFHPTAGPKITYQYPEDFVSKEVFDAVSVYIIPKPQLQRSILTVNALGHKIVGYPVKIDNPKYDRNAFYFNVCFVCDAWARSVQYEPVVKKFSEYLVVMERESGFLSDEQSKARLPGILKQVLHQLNTQRVTTVTVDTTVIQLKIARVAADPPPVHDHHVPVFVEDRSSFRSEEWDLTTQQILPFIDGLNHVAKVAALADVENNLVKACTQNLVYYGVVQLTPIFQYSNVYAPTPHLRRLANEPQLQESCLNFVAKSESTRPVLRDVLRLYCSMTRATSVRDLCLRLAPHTLGIDERRLVQFGLLHGLLRRIHKYPVQLTEHTGQKPRGIQRLFMGALFYDEICCRTGLGYQELDDIVERDAHIITLCK